MKFARFLPQIFDDLSGACKWYDEAGGSVLGDRFVQAFYASVHRTAFYAEAHAMVYGKFRRVLVEPFPYKLYFRVAGDDVVFVLLIHAARDPRVVQRILRERK